MDPYAYAQAAAQAPYQQYPYAPTPSHVQVGGKRPFTVPPPPSQAPYNDQDDDEASPSSDDGDGGDGDFDGRGLPSEDEDERARPRVASGKGKGRGFADDAETNPELYGLRRSVCSSFTLASDHRRSDLQVTSSRRSTLTFALVHRIGLVWKVDT